MITLKDIGESFADTHPYINGWGKLSLSLMVISAIIMFMILIIQRNKTESSIQSNRFEMTIGILFIISVISTLIAFGVRTFIGFNTDEYQTYEGHAKVERIVVANDDIHKRYITLSDHGKDATYRVSEDKVEGIHQHETIHVKMKISPQFGEEKAPKQRKLSDLASYTDEDTNTNKIEYDSITFTKVGN